MGYNNKNTLIIAKKVQEVYLKHAKEGVTTISIYRNHIYPVFFISKATFYNYLTINVNKELKKHGLEDTDIKAIADEIEPENSELIETITRVVKEQLAISNKDLIINLSTMIKHIEQCLNLV